MTQTTKDGRPIEVVDNAEQSRYEAWLDGVLVGRAVYRAEPHAVVFTHTEVDPDRQGQGIAQALAEGALDQVRAAGRAVVPQCPFIAAYVGKHPQYADLVRSER